MLSVTALLLVRVTVALEPNPGSLGMSWEHGIPGHHAYTHSYIHLNQTSPQTGLLSGEPGGTPPHGHEGEHPEKLKADRNEPRSCEAGTQPAALL